MFDNLKPTSNLYDNLLKLAVGLRQIKNIEQASILENKIALFKLAEKNILSEAHPEGNVKDPLFEVKRIDNIQKETVNKIEKNPTGKQALLNELSKLLKTSQETATPNVKEDNITIPDEKDEANESGEVEIVTPEKQQKIQEINTQLSQMFPEILNNINQAVGLIGLNQISQQDQKPILQFTPARILGDSDSYNKLYATRSGINFELLKKYIEIYKQIYWGQQFDSLTVINKLHKIPSYEGLIQFGNIIDPQISNKYFRGSQPGTFKNMFQDDSQEYTRDNPNSVWEFGVLGSKASKNKGKIAEAGEALHQKMVDFEKSIFSQELLDKVNQGIQQEVSTLASPLFQLAKDFEVAPEVTEKTKSLGTLIMNLFSKEKILDQYNNLKSQYFIKLDSILKIMNSSYDSSKFIESINDAKTGIQSTITWLQERPLSVGDKPIDAETAGILAGNFRTAYRIWKVYKNKFDTKSKEYQNYLANQNMSAQLFNALNDAVGKPYSVVAKSITSILPKATTISALKQEAQNWLDTTLSVAGQAPTEEFKTQEEKDTEAETRSGVRANLNTKFKKESQLQGIPSKQTRPASQLTSAPKQTGTVQRQISSITPEIKAVVQRMQFALIDFANKMAADEDRVKKFPAVVDNDINIIISTGKKGVETLDQLDGAWGTNTQNALLTAQKLIDSYNSIHKDKPFPGKLDTTRYLNSGKDPKDVIAAGKENIRILYFFGRTVGYAINVGQATEDANKIYDNVPNQFIPDTLSQEGNIPLVKPDIANLDNFYKFLISKGIAQPQYAVEEGKDGAKTATGLPGKLWRQFLDWLVARAKNQFAKAEQKLKPLKQEYYSDELNLSKMLDGLMKSLGVDSKNEDAIIPDSSLLGTGSQGTGQIAGNKNDQIAGGKQPYSSKGLGSGKNQDQNDQSGNQNATQNAFYKTKGKNRLIGTESDEGASLTVLKGPTAGQYPFGKVIDLANAPFDGSYLDKFDNNGILTYDRFYNGNPVTLAKVLFPGKIETTDQDQFNAMIYELTYYHGKILGKTIRGTNSADIEVWAGDVDGNGNPAGRGQWVESTRVINQNRVSNLLNLSPIRYLMQFLQYIIRDCAQTRNDWLRMATDQGESDQVIQVVDRNAEQWIYQLNQLYRKAANYIKGAYK